MFKRCVCVVSVLALCAVCLLAASPASAVDYTKVDKPGLDAMVRDSGAKVVLVNFWASWCMPCRAEIPGLNALAGEYNTTDLEILGVSVDQSRAALEKFLTQQPLDYRVLWGNLTIAQACGITAVPRTILYDAQRKVVLDSSGLLSDGDLRSAIEKAMAQ